MPSRCWCDCIICGRHLFHADWTRNTLQLPLSVLRVSFVPLFSVLVVICAYVCHSTYTLDTVLILFNCLSTASQ